MSIRATCTSLLASVLLACSAVPSGTGRYTDAMFAAALDNDSTAPEYLLVTIIDPTDGARRTVCIEAPFLLGALLRQQHLSFDRTSVAAARRMASASEGHVFLLSADALAGAVRYMAALRDVARGLASQHDDVALRDSAVIDRLLVAVGRADPRATRGACQQAVAHALLERGIRCYMDDRTGALAVVH